MRFRFVDDRLGANPRDHENRVGAPYIDGIGEIPQILLAGTFAEPNGPLPDELDTALRATLAAPIISELWNANQVIVVQMSKTDDFPVDPCDGDNVLSADVKFCDADRNAFFLQLIPIAIDAMDHQDPATYAVPGFEDIGDFGLNVEAITQAVRRNQAESGLLGGGVPQSEFVTQLTSKNAADIRLQDTIFMNMPLCEIDRVRTEDVGGFIDDNCDEDDANVSNISERICTTALTNNTTYSSHSVYTR